MGMFFGNRFYAYTPEDIFQSKVVMVSLMPAPLSSGVSDSCYAPLQAHEEHLSQYRHYDSAAEAKVAVKRIILQRTVDLIAECVVAIEYAKNDIDVCRLVISDGSPNSKDARIAARREDIAQMQTEIKALRKLRRQSVRVE